MKSQTGCALSAPRSKSKGQRGSCCNATQNTGIWPAGLRCGFTQQLWAPTYLLAEAGDLATMTASSCEPGSEKRRLGDCHVSKGCSPAPQSIKATPQHTQKCQLVNERFPKRKLKVNFLWKWRNAYLRKKKLSSRHESYRLILRKK